MKKTHIYPLAALLLCLFTLQACVKTDDVVEETSSLWYHEAGNLVSISGDETQAEFQITDTYFRLLERSIRRNPEYWLWSHDRWKRTRERFNRRFEVVDGKVHEKATPDPLEY